MDERGDPVDARRVSGFEDICAPAEDLRTSVATAFFAAEDERGWTSAGLEIVVLIPVLPFSPANF